MRVAAAAVPRTPVEPPALAALAAVGMVLSEARTVSTEWMAWGAAVGRPRVLEVALTVLG